MEVKTIAEIQFSIHAVEMLKERNISEEWVEVTIRNPDRVESGLDGNDHFIKPILEYEGRFLRIVVNKQINPNRAVTVFFDRRLGRKT